MKAQSVEFLPTEYSVASLSVALRNAVETQFGRVRVRGEVSGLKHAASGHIYFRLKDMQAEAVIDVACWKRQALQLKIAPEDGMEIIAEGQVTVYAPRSSYQLILERMELAGLGALLQLLEARRRKLAAEGLFQQNRKRSLPAIPSCIGVVTSLQGAVIQDILRVVRTRFPCRVLIWPSSVQGASAEPEIIAGIEGMNALPESIRPEVLILARGGGSLEDLWAFNEEQLVRTAANSAIPLVSAIGHETDRTLLDEAADYSASTPTAAAEHVLPRRSELAAQLENFALRLTNLVLGVQERAQLRLEMPSQSLRSFPLRLENEARSLDEAEKTLHQSVRKLQHALQETLRFLVPTPPNHFCAARKRESAFLWQSLCSGIRNRQRQWGQALSAQIQLLEALSYERVLERGYALIEKPGGGLVTTIRQARQIRALTIRFAGNERLPVTVPRASPPTSEKAKSAPEILPRQPDLL